MKKHPQNNDSKLFSHQNNNSWLFEIHPEGSKSKINFKEIYAYKDLLFLFVKRDIISVYKQTVLGPLWFIISPLLSSIIQFWVFGKLANLPSDGIPYFLFVLGGNILWSYFSSLLIATSNTFRTNQTIFGKVYFPRVIMPLSNAISNLFQFSIRLVLLLIFILGMGLFSKMNVYLFAIPFLIFILSLIAIGLGMIISSLTTKYRDFAQLLGFVMNIAIYVTPVIYPTSMFLNKVPLQKQWIIYLNPLTSIFDFFRYAFFDTGNLNFIGLLYSVVFSLVAFLIGILIFSQTEKNFIDTI
jgi:lipopolysaccharide transport system permease protein